jgi:hypothetical protein
MNPETGRILVQEVIDLAQKAGQARYHFLASCLYFVAQAALRDELGPIAELLALRDEKHRERNHEPT